MSEEYVSLVSQMTAEQQSLEETLKVTESFVKKFYLEDLQDFSVQAPLSKVNNITYANRIRIFHIKGIVINKSEKNIEKLNNVFGALHCLGLSLVTLLEFEQGNVSLYMGIKSRVDIANEDALNLVFEKVFLGNFPGCDIELLTNAALEKMLSSILPEDGKNSVSAMTSLPSLKDEDMGNQYFVQGLEKFIDSMQNDKFSMIIISDPVSQGQVEVIKQGYEELYSELFSLAEIELTVGKTDCINMSRSDMEGFTDTVGKSVSKTQSYTKGTTKTKSSSRTNTIGVSMGMMGSAGTSSSTTETITGNIGASYIVNAGGSIAKGVMNGVSSTLGLNAGAFGSTAKTTGETEGNDEHKQVGNAEEKNESKAHSIQISMQEGYSLASNTTSTVKFENKSIKGILDCIDEQLERLKECGNYGMWSSAIYFVSSKKESSVIAAASYKSLVSGESTAIEQPCINTWSDPQKTSVINKYLRKLSHPKFFDADYKVNLEALTDISATTMISTKELSLQSNIPYRSVSGVYVREMASFGRNVIEQKSDMEEAKIQLGSIYHMGKYEKNPRVNINVERLKEHVFVTGSTGSGKSNTVYELLSKINQCKIKENSQGVSGKVTSLVIESAKGEYKQIFGETYNIYGTNPYYTELLRINPFRFENDIHVLEHIDRLVDIFNVCWPMYAAMPAVLKEAVEQAYIDAGWDLELSKCKYDSNLYPSFADILYCLRKVISESDYSQEVKDNYTGSLITRVKSLTTGLNGQIFTSNEVDSRKLFNENTIIDLSRVGSSETKSMIMGILIMRLQEFRMNEGGINLPLKHVTVIEEAHNLLKKTSTEQSSEGANLIGKSVEMISNAIAEMRTYGEGFIIVDQAPGLLDMSSIRNTNTKIIMRLPEYSDRELVGKSAGLNDEQIIELAKIPSGVAAIYQNKWVEPILCQVDYYDVNPSGYKRPDSKIKSTSEKKLREDIIDYILSDINQENVDLDAEHLIERLTNSNVPVLLKIELSDVLRKDKPQTLSDVYDLVADCVENLDEIFLKSAKAKNIEEWNQILWNSLNYERESITQEGQYNILECLIYKKSSKKGNDCQEFNRWMEYMGRSVK